MKIIAEPTEIIWKKVFDFPRKFTLDFLTKLIERKYCLTDPMANSLAIKRMEKKSNKKLSKWNGKNTNRIQINNLSANKSRFSPNMDSWLYFLARKPSIKSVKHPNKNINRARYSFPEAIR